MARFKHTDNSQGLFLTVSLSEQLLPGTFEWTIDYLINRIDLSLFEQNYHNDEKGAAAYPPKVLLKTVLYCYSKGIISSRKIEMACRENIIAKALAEGCEPDHGTIAGFISSNNEAVKDLFARVLLQCSQLKLITGEMFAIDGLKLPSNASKEWSGTISELSKKRDKLEKYIERLVLQHRKLDHDESANKKLSQYKKTMGDNDTRREKSIQRLEKKLKKLNTYLETAKPKMGTRHEIQTNITDAQSARIKSPHGYIQGYNGVAIADSANQVIICAQAIGCGPEAGSFPQMLGSLEENMKLATGKKVPLKKSLVEGDTGFFSEDNLQEAKKRKVEVLIPDHQFRQRDPYFAEKKKEKVPKKERFKRDDFAYNKKKDIFVCPAGNTLEYKCAVKLHGNTGKRYHAKIGDCRSCHLRDKCINVRTGCKKTVRTLYIADQKYKENLSEKMKNKIDKPVYRELYSRRMQIIEPVFSNIAYCKGMDRFTLRTQEKVKIQWQLVRIAHNLWKCVKPLGLTHGK
jgi:transposase